MKGFNLEKAKNGAKICTRNGKPVKILCFDKNGEDPIVALIDNGSYESVETYFENGTVYKNIVGNGEDLVMKIEKKQGWVNLYKPKSGIPNLGAIYDTEKEAKSKIIKDKSYITTIKIEWEE